MIRKRGGEPRFVAPGGKAELGQAEFLRLEREIPDLSLNGELHGCGSGVPYRLSWITNLAIVALARIFMRDGPFSL